MTLKIILCISTMMACGAAGAMGSPVTISTGGTWGTLTSSDAYFVSNEAWTLTFQVASPLVVLGSDPTYFKTTYSNATYTLNGSTVALTGTAVYFYVTESFSFCINVGCSETINSFTGSPELFAGSAPAAPALVPGSYQTTGPGFAAFEPSGHAGNTAGDPTILVTQGTGVPEPSTWALCGAGLIFALARLRQTEKGKNV